MTSIKDIIKNITASVTLIAEEVNNVEPEAVVEEEQIDELSKNTLIKYSTKSTKDQFNAAFDGDNDRISKRAKGETMTRKKIDKLTKEDVMNREELEISGVFNEDEINRLDEISKGAVANYIGKASTDVHNTAYRAGKKDGDLKNFDTDGILKSIKRQMSIKKAASRLAKEEVEITEARERTPNFRFTHKPGDKGSEKKLADLKANKAPHEVVSMKPRLGKNSPHADLYKKGGELSRKDIKKQHASHFDVYVHPKHDHPHWTKIRDAEADENRKSHISNNNALKTKFDSVAHKTLTKHGYDKVGESPHDTVYAHFNNKTGVHHTATISKAGVAAAFHTNKATGSTFHSWTTSHADHHKETMDNLPVKFEAHVIGEHEQHHKIHHSMREDFQIDFEKELIEHEEYGLGNIIYENDETVEVAFETGIILLNK